MVHAGSATRLVLATLPGVQLYRSWGFGDEQPQDLVMPDGVVVPGVAMSRPV